MMKGVCFAAAAAAILAASGPANAASKKECGYQADIVKAVQQARLDRVKERNVTDVVLAGQVTWPERYNDTISIFAGEVYKHKVRDLKAVDLSAQWRETCLNN